LLDLLVNEDALVYKVDLGKVQDVGISVGFSRHQMGVRTQLLNVGIVELFMVFLDDAEFVQVFNLFEYPIFCVIAFDIKRCFSRKRDFPKHGFVLV